MQSLGITQILKKLSSCGSHAFPFYEKNRFPWPYHESVGPEKFLVTSPLHRESPQMHNFYNRMMLPWGTGLAGLPPGPIKTIIISFVWEKKKWRHILMCRQIIKLLNKWFQIVTLVQIMATLKTWVWLCSCDLENEEGTPKETFSELVVGRIYNEIKVCLWAGIQILLYSNDWLKYSNSWTTHESSTGLKTPLISLFLP